MVAHNGGKTDKEFPPCLTLLIAITDPVSKSDAQVPPTHPRQPLIQIDTVLLVAMFTIGATGYFRLSARMDGLSTSANARMDRLDAKVDAGIKELRNLYSPPRPPNDGKTPW